MAAQCINLNISCREDDLTKIIEESSEQSKLTKAYAFAEILREYPKLLAYKHRVYEINQTISGRVSTLN